MATNSQKRSFKIVFSLKLDELPRANTFSIRPVTRLASVCFRFEIARVPW